MTLGDKRIPTPAEFERQLVQFINITLLGGNAAVDRDTRLFEDGYMNSLRILDLIAMVEKTLGRRVPDRSVRLANFRTIATIVSAFHPDAGSESLASAPTDRVFEHRTNRDRVASPIAALHGRGDLQIAGSGQVALAGVALEVFEAVDRTVMRWAAALGSATHRYPSMIGREVLEKAGRTSAAVVSAGGNGSRLLAPAVCYHAYPEWSGKTLGNAPAILTARGRCYRHENGGYAPLERLWEFTMREIIVIGARDQVEDVRRTLVMRVSELVTTLGLDASIDAASDPFFAPGDEGRRLMQRAAALKHELQLTVDASGRSIAAASFNHHYDFFGARFDIRLADGTAAHSGCIAFGLERWVLALFSQLGPNESDWPSAAREWLRGAPQTGVGA